MGNIIWPSRFATGGGGSTLDPNIKLLMGFEGTNGSTTFTDESSAPHTMTANGNAAITTSQFKFGSSSAAFDGSGDFISTPDSADWDFGSGAFTIEGFFRFLTKTDSQAMIGQWDNAGSVSASAFFFFVQSGSLTMRLCNVASAVDISVGWTPTLGTWYHLAYDRDATGKGRLYRDGTMVASNATSHNFAINNSAASLVLGRIGTSTTFSSFDFNGNMDEVRITKGAAQYGSDSGYTVPTSAFPRS